MMPVRNSSRLILSPNKPLMGGIEQLLRPPVERPDEEDEPGKRDDPVENQAEAARVTANASVIGQTDVGGRWMPSCAPAPPASGWTSTSCGSTVETVPACGSLILHASR